MVYGKDKHGLSIGSVMPSGSHQIASGPGSCRTSSVLWVELLVFQMGGFFPVYLGTMNLATA